jgi:hypothetical protein
MTLAAERVTQSLSSELASKVHDYLRPDERFAKRRMGSGS